MMPLKKHKGWNNMKIIVSTHQGVIYDEEVDHVVVHDQSDGEYAIFNNHIPVVSVLEEGYIKLVREENELFIALISGILEFHDNFATVLVQEAHAGSTLESAKEHLLDLRKERLEKNRQESSDFTKMEKELLENIRGSKAGSL